MQFGWARHSANGTLLVLASLTHTSGGRRPLLCKSQLPPEVGNLDGDVLFVAMAEHSGPWSLGASTSHVHLLLLMRVSLWLSSEMKSGEEASPHPPRLLSHVGLQKWIKT